VLRQPSSTIEVVGYENKDWVLDLGRDEDYSSIPLVVIYQLIWVQIQYKDEYKVKRIGFDTDGTRIYAKRIYSK
jgi:hypothetical protein